MEPEVRAASENVNDVNAFPTFLSVSRGKTNVACRRCAMISHDDVTEDVTNQKLLQALIEENPVTLWMRHLVSPRARVNERFVVNTW